MAALNGAQMQTLGSTLEFSGHDRKVQHWKDVLLLNVTQGKITDCFLQCGDVLKHKYREYKQKAKKRMKLLKEKHTKMNGR